MYSDSYTLRSRARQALKGNWQTALLVSFGASALGLVLNALQSRIQVDLSALSGASLADLQTLINSALRSQSLLLSLLQIVNFLISPALALGMYAYFLKLHRTEETSFSTLFSRLGILLRALGQTIMIGLLMIGWALLFLIPLFGLAYLSEMPSALFMILSLAAAALLVMIGLRYAMASYVMADEPQTGIMASIRRSKELMEGQKGRLFTLGLSFIGWYLLAVLVIGVLEWMLGTLGMALGMLISLVVGVYLQSAVTAFYLELTGYAPDADAQRNAA